MKTAHYFASKAKKFVIISEDLTPYGVKIAVAGKAEARKVAATHNAKPWNF